MWRRLSYQIVFVLLARSSAHGQQSFRSPEEASQALFSAADSGDPAALLAVLGPSAKEIISSGDFLEDLDERLNFVVRYKEMHRLKKEPDGTATLYVGAEHWPTPIPIVHKNGAWKFDTDAAKQAILYRRFGRNEISAIQACRDLVDAQRLFHSESKKLTGTTQYARRFVSKDGSHDGLFWKGALDEFDSPVDPLIAEAGIEISGSATGVVPRDGYNFRILTRQGRNAAGGEKNYIVNGKLAAGFAILAFPAEYGVSGIMSFVANQDGRIYEKDLGPDTSNVASMLRRYDPDPSWRALRDGTNSAGLHGKR